MKVTEQIDAMQASAVDPYKYLAATRVLACVLMLPLLTLVGDFFGVGFFVMTFPTHRPRRLRRTEAIRSLVRETHLGAGSLIYPMFACPGLEVKKEVAAIFWYSKGSAVARLAKLAML